MRQPANARGEGSAPAIIRRRIVIRIGTRWSLQQAGPGAAADRIARQIEHMSGGRIQAVVTTISTDGIRSIADGIVDTYVGCDLDSRDLHPAIACFSGLPRYTGFDMEGQRGWLRDGGRALWDELLGGLGVKPLLAGSSRGPSILWTRTPISGADGLRGLRVATSGEALDLIESLGAQPSFEPLPRAMLALATGQLDAVECTWPFPASVIAPPGAVRFAYPAALHGYGQHLTFGVSRRLWDRLGSGEQAVLQVAAGDELQRAEWSTPDGAQSGDESGEVNRKRLDAGLERKLDEAAASCLAQIARHDSIGRRIEASMRTARRNAGDDAMEVRRRRARGATFATLAARSDRRWQYAMESIA